MAHRVNDSRIIQLRAVCSLVLLAGFVLGGATVARADDYGWWPLNDGSGAVAKNLVDGGTDGDIVDHDVAGLGANGSVWVNDPERGMVLGLAGSTGWVNAGFLPPMSMDNQFSWSFWGKQAAGQGVNNDIIIGNRWDEFGVDTSPREFIKFTPTQFEYHMNGAASGNIPYDPFTATPPDEADIPSNDEWIHHAVVKQGDSLTYFRDGEVASSRTISVGMASPDPLPFALGGQADTEQWRGYLSDVQLYESALDATGIASTMAGDLADGADLYARWMLNDGDDDTATDQGPNNFDGLIIDWDIDGLADDGTVWVDDPDRGTVLGLGGNSAWVDAGEIPLMDLENDFTWAFWARQDPDQASPANDILIGNRYDEFGADTSPREFIKFTPDRFEFHMEGTGSGDLQYDQVEDGPWVNHIVVKDGDNLAYYRDGEFAGEGFVGEDQLSEDPFVFAMGGQNGNETWAGFLSEVRLFDHSLSAEEIAELSSGSSSIPGDYNNNGELDEPDLNLQADEIVKGPAADLSFDLNDDDVVDSEDRKLWVEDREFKFTWIGDANLDLEFNSSDMVQVFAGGKYETLQEATWGEGDFNGDKVFDSGDMVAAFAGGGYEEGPRELGGPAAVPEPTSIALLLLGLLGAVSHSRRR